ncbi:hypothetical protein AC249_AIPGENE1991 [Exaiptasia diaphana]|nr:hypothetical protein AC249_AIPGENE1991 [Exaiptasia diaphana]
MTFFLLAHAGFSPNIKDLPDINATVGDNVTFKFTDDVQMSINSCQFGLEANPPGTKPGTVLNEVMYNTTTRKFYVVRNADSRVTWAGLRIVKAWFNINNVKMSDAGTYRVWCNFTGGEDNAKAVLRFNEVPTTPPASTTTSAAATNSTTATAAAAAATNSTTATQGKTNPTTAGAAKADGTKHFPLMVPMLLFFLNI